jgi:WD40 repeat protein
VWDSESGEEILRIKAHPGDYRMGWFPDSERIYTAGDEGYAKVWRVQVARLSASCRSDCPPIPGQGWYSVPSWSPDGRHIARTFKGGLVIVWDVASGQEAFRLPDEVVSDATFAGSVITVQWSPDGSDIATADGDGHIKIWDASNGEKTLTILADEEVFDSFFALRAFWSPDGTRIVSTSEHDGKATVWDARSGELLLSLADHNPRSISWSPDGASIVTSSDDGSAKVWDASTGTVLLDLMPADFAFHVSGVAWSPNGALIATFSEDKLGRIWDAQTGQELLQFPADSNIDPLVFWSPSGDRLLTSGFSGDAKVWDAHTGHELLSLETGSAMGASWSPDGSLLAIGDMWHHLQVFPAWQTLDELIQYAHEHAVIRQLTDAEREQFGLQLE